MLRLFTLFCAVTILAFFTSGLAADDKNPKDNKDKSTATKDNKGKGTQAKITSVDTKAGTVTVKMKDKSGKEVEKTFKLTGEVRYFDSTGRVAAADIFRSGDFILVVEEEGRLREVHKDKDQSKKDKEKK